MPDNDVTSKDIAGQLAGLLDDFAAITQSFAANRRFYRREAGGGGYAGAGDKGQLEPRRRGGTGQCKRYRRA